ncbi:hypothetical protein ACWDNI_37140, partial [Nocardia niigatensis]
GRLRNTLRRLRNALGGHARRLRHARQVAVAVRPPRVLPPKAVAAQYRQARPASPTGSRRCVRRPPR